MNAASCPYCRTPFEKEEDAHPCPGCSTPHHAECWEENGGCTVFGCSEAPVEEAKITVAGSEVGVAQGYSYTFSSHDTTGVAPPPPAFDGAASQASSTRPVSSAAHSMLGLSDPFPGDSSHSAVGLPSRTDRKTYVLLGFFFGYLGVHNLYANRMKVGIIQLCVTALSCFIASPATWVWALVEICTIDRDGDDQLMP